ncbi:DUF6037 family protein [Paraburkholderia sp. MM6662-R1]|uniref:DUF6037 family protein n=1 Tax=Paraburkholderia sp. MM6662-R1 TaxID=2991066 RepID=UPI003D20EB21
MGIKLEALSQLYDSMTSQGMTKTKFEFRFRNLWFSVVYLTDSFPHELLFGCHAHNLFFVVAVGRDFVIGTYLGNAYKPLLDALGLEPDPKQRFSPNVFFEEFKTAIPRSTTPANAPTITDIASVRRDVDEINKIYFVGWIHHDGISSKPTEANLLKTRRICGFDVYERCKRHYISSRWSDIEKDRRPYHEPKV